MALFNTQTAANGIDNDGLARRFTDSHYYTKEDIDKKYGGNSFNSQADSIMRIISEYRRRYAFNLDLPRFDRRSTTTTLTPKIMARYNINDRSMVYYSARYNLMEISCYATCSNKLKDFLSDIHSQELYTYANHLNVEINKNDILYHLRNNEPINNVYIDGYYRAIRYLMDNQNVSIDTSGKLVKELWLMLNPSFHSDYSIIRNEELLDPIINDKKYNHFRAEESDKLNQMFAKLLSFIGEQQSLSSFTLAAAFYSAFIYISPLKSHNLEIANLLFMKIMANESFGDASYTLNFSSYIDRNIEAFNKAFGESFKTGDMTYSMIFVADMVTSIIMKNVALLETEEVPVVEPGKVIERVVEKEVIKEVEVNKEVEVEVIKEAD